MNKIHDNRKKFTKDSFSNIKKNKLLNDYTLSMYYNNINDALKYTGEMLCSIYIYDLWKIYIQFYCNYIHINNIRLGIYLNQKFDEFKNCMKQIQNDYEIRNDDKLRHLFFTLTLLFCHSNKENRASNLFIDFDIHSIHDNLKADNVEYIQKYFLSDDPKEYYIPINEFIYHLENKDKTQIFYWINWIIEYDLYLIKHKKQIFIQKRSITNFSNNKKDCNIIWLLWYIIIQYSKLKHGMIHKTILSLCELFKIKYTYTNNKTYRCLLYTSIHILIDNVDTNIKLNENMDIFKDIEQHIKNVFEHLKKKEIWNEEDKTSKEKMMDMVYKI